VHCHGYTRFLSVGFANKCVKRDKVLTTHSCAGMGMVEGSVANKTMNQCKIQTHNVGCAEISSVST
jgi:hypothetical protein